MSTTLFKPKSIVMSLTLAASFAGNTITADCIPPAIAEKSGEAISIVGWIDLDNDGVSDRGRLYQALQSGNGWIENEVDDEGLRTPANRQVTARSKFLILATIPDPDNVQDPKRRQAAKRILQHSQTMQAEARKAGVRIVHLEAFVRFGGPRRWPDRGKTSRIYRGRR